jgi:MFS family permease
MGSSERHRFTGRFWALIGATFLGFLGIGTVLPELGPHIRYDLGGSDQTVGLVIGVFSFVALSTRLISGPLADRRGRKITFLTGLFSCGLAGFAYLLPLGIAGPYLARGLQGFGEACLYTGAATWVVEVGGIDRGSQSLGYLSSGIWGGISVGPVVGQWLGSFQSAALLQTVAALVGFVIVTRVREEYKPTAPSARRHWIPKSLVPPGIAVGFVNVQYPVITGFLVLHLAGHGNSGPAAFSTWAVMILLARFFLGRLPDRVHPAITFYSGLSGMAIGLALLAAGPSPVFAVTAAAILGFGFSFPWSSILATVLRKTPSGERGSTIGVLSAFYDLFVGGSSFVAGAVAKHFGYSAAFVMATVALAGAAIAGRFVFAGTPNPVSFEYAGGPSGTGTPRQTYVESRTANER